MSTKSLFLQIPLLLLVSYTLIGCSGVQKIKNDYETTEKDSVYTKMVMMRMLDNQIFEMHDCSQTEEGYMGTINIEEPWKHIPRKANFVVFYPETLTFKEISPQSLEVNIPYHQIYRTVHTEDSEWASAKRNSALVFTLLSITLYAVSSIGVL